MAGVTFRHQKPGQKAYSSGQVSEEPLTYAFPDAVTIGAASTVILAAASSGVGRVVILYVPEAAVGGVHLNVAGAATTSKFLLEPGKSIPLNTLQEIRGIRAGASDVTVYLYHGVVT